MDGYEITVVFWLYKSSCINPEDLASSYTRSSCSVWQDDGRLPLSHSVAGSQCLQISVESSLQPMTFLPRAMIASSPGVFETLFVGSHNFCSPRLPSAFQIVLPWFCMPLSEQSERKPPLAAFATHVLLTNLQQQSMHNHTENSSCVNGRYRAGLS